MNVNGAGVVSAIVLQVGSSVVAGVGLGAALLVTGFLIRLVWDGGMLWWVPGRWRGRGFRRQR